MTGKRGLKFGNHPGVFQHGSLSNQPGQVFYTRGFGAKNYTYPIRVPEHVDKTQYYMPSKLSTPNDQSKWQPEYPVENVVKLNTQVPVTHGSAEGEELIDIKPPAKKDLIGHGHGHGHEQGQGQYQEGTQSNCRPHQHCEMDFVTPNQSISEMELNTEPELTMGNQMMFTPGTNSNFVQDSAVNSVAARSQEPISVANPNTAHTDSANSVSARSEQINGTSNCPNSVTAQDPNSVSAQSDVTAQDPNSVSAQSEQITSNCPNVGEGFGQSNYSEIDTSETDQKIKMLLNSPMPISSQQFEELTKTLQPKAKATKRKKKDPDGLGRKAFKFNIV